MRDKNFSKIENSFYEDSNENKNIDEQTPEPITVKETFNNDVVSGRSESDEDKAKKILQELQDNSEEEIGFFTIEQENKIKEIFLRLKQKIENPQVSQKVKDLLMSAEVVGVLVDIKPASYIQPKTEKRLFKIFKRRDGLSKKDLEEFESILQEFDVEFHTFAQDDENAFIEKEKYGFELIYIFKHKKLLDLLTTSGLFNEDEIKTAEENPGLFFDYMNGTKIGYASVARIGAVYGYPVSDVVDFIERQKILDKYKKEGISSTVILKALKDKDEKKLKMLLPEDLRIMIEFQERSSGMHISGMNDSIDWVSTNADSEEVRRVVGKMKRAFEIQKEILGKN